MLFDRETFSRLTDSIAQRTTRESSARDVLTQQALRLREDQLEAQRLVAALHAIGAERARFARDRTPPPDTVPAHLLAPRRA